MQSYPKEKSFTRAALYELVWSRPRTALAKELGFSDVAITKYCKAARIPTPAMGYWAKLAAGRKAVRFPLPPRLPGQSDSVTMGGNPHAWRWPPTEDGSLIDEPVAPVFLEDMEQQVAAAVKRVGRVVATRDLNTPDKALAKVLQSEAKRREHGADNFSWHKPRFDDPVFQRHLRLFNSIARALGAVYGIQSVGEGDEWFQGRGTLYHLTLHLGFGGAGMYLRVHEPGEPKRDRRPDPVKVTTLRIEKGGYEEEILEWTDQKGRKLESQLTEIVGAILRRAEERLRGQEQRYYERQCEHRNEQLAAIEKRRLDEEKKQLAAISAHRAKVRDEVIGLAKRRRRAEDIRATVAALRKHPEVETPEGSVRFEAWAAHALKIASDIDPMNSSLKELLGTFSVSTE